MSEETARFAESCMARAPIEGAVLGSSEAPRERKGSCFARESLRPELFFEGEESVESSKLDNDSAMVLSREAGKGAMLGLRPGCAMGSNEAGPYFGL